MEATPHIVVATIIVLLLMLISIVVIVLLIVRAGPTIAIIRLMATTLVVVEWEAVVVHGATVVLLISIWLEVRIESPLIVLEVTRRGWWLVHLLRVVGGRLSLIWVEPTLRSKCILIWIEGRCTACIRIK